MKHKVKISMDVPYYGDVPVSAKSPEEARLKVQMTLGKGREMSDPLFDGVKMEPDYTEAGMVSALSDEPPAPPKRRKSKKVKAPTFRNDG